MENKIQEEPLFLAAPFFMARISLLPIDYFSSLIQRNDPHAVLLALFEDDPLVREAIMIASPTLYKALVEKKDKSQTAASLFKYVNRMCSRATPFGLFSCVSLGEWGESASTGLDLDQIYKRARPDMGWLSLVIDQFCKDPLVIPFLSVRKNPLLFESGGRVSLEYVRGKKQGEKKTLTSIRLSFLTEAIFELTQHPIPIEELKDQLVLRFPTLEKEKLQGVIEKLLQEQFLDFNLRPSLLSESPFAEVLSKLSSISSASPLSKIATHINNYSQISPGQGEEELKHIQQMMGEMFPAPNFLQVDAAYAGTKITLPKIVIAELQKSVELLWKIANITPPSSLESYHEKFLDKYGTCRTVPLLELLTEGGGLGIPENYNHSTSENSFKDDPKRKKWNEWLQKQWVICLREKLQEIELDEKIINEINKQPAKETALLSFDLRCEVFANTAEEIDQGRFFLQIEPFAWQAGATFGRFIDLLGNEAKNKLQVLLKEEEALDEESLFVESSYHHVNLSRTANVMIHPNLRNHSIDLGGIGTISLSEIYIGATTDRLYVTRKDGGKELRITSSNMLNPTSAPIPLRFIRDVSSSKYRLLDLFSWHELATAFFLPRIRYKTTIFSPAQWKVDLFQLTCTSKDSIEVIEKAFCQWADMWQLPRYLLMAEEDNRLLLDRHHPAHLREIALEIKKGKKAHLIEKIGQELTGQVKSQKGTHHVEFMIPFIKNKKYCPTVSQPLPIMHQPIPTHSRCRLPGSDWLFVKYYLGAENENRFLMEECQSFAKSFLERGIITGWFFVRYADPQVHLRLRFCGKQGQILTHLIPEVHEWAMTLIQKQKIREMALSTYEREIERFGGEELIEPAENLFCADTETTMLLIRAMSEKRTSLADEVVAAVSLIDLLKGLGLSLKEQIAFFSSLSMSKEDLAGFRQWKNPLLSICRTFFENNVAMENDALFLHEAFQKRALSLQAYTTTLRELGTKQKLITSAYSIYDSILHMHYNRFIGRSGQEKKVRLYAYHALNLFQEQQGRRASR